MTDAKELPPCPMCGTGIVYTIDGVIHCPSTRCHYSNLQEDHLALCARLKAGEEAIKKLAWFEQAIEFARPFVSGYKLGSEKYLPMLTPPTEETEEKETT